MVYIYERMTIKTLDMNDLDGESSGILFELLVNF